MNRNEFVDYLNTMNSSNASSKGALAEAQVQTQYFDRINVRRQLSDQLLEYARDPNPVVVFLTGHAGDGKTSLLAQLLYDLKCLQPGEQLLEYHLYEFEPGRRLFYVKDMSELTKDSQERLCQQAFQAVNDNKASAVVVTNTGPLINTLKRLAGNTGEDFESTILGYLDRSVSEVVPLLGSRARFVNVARLPNFKLAAKVLARMVDQELWDLCEECEARAKCSILSNVRIVRRHLHRISQFLDSHYRYLEEYARRMTARQIAAHLSYALTGGRRCEDMSKSKESEEEQLFKYHFANLFFGYEGIDPDPKTDQIRSIQELRSMALDQKPVRIDPKHHVGEEAQQPDFRMFVLPSSFPDLDKETREIVAHARDRVVISKDNRAAKYRQFYWSVRRFHILFSTNKRELSETLDSLYSPVYSLYQQATSSELSAETRLAIEQLVFEALYNLYVGMPPFQDSNTLYLTVRRSYTITQYVQLIEGEIKRFHLRITQEPACSSTIDDTDGIYDLKLRVEPNNEGSFHLTLPILDYFWRLSRGEVSTTLSPTLSHGIDRLKNLLRTASRSGSHSTGGEIRLLVMTNYGPKIAALKLDDNRLNVYGYS